MLGDNITILRDSKAKAELRRHRYYIFFNSKLKMPIIVISLIFYIIVLSHSNSSVVHLSLSNIL